MTWTLRDAKKERAITDRIEQGDDRSAGILAGAFIQDRLVMAIKARMINDKTVYGLVFKGNGPLANFSSQIDIAYLLGILNEYIREHMHRIREIRNRFAHRLEAHSFDTQIISDLCVTLFRIPSIKILKEGLEREVGGNMTEIVKVWLGPLVVLEDTPRNAYLNTIKIILFFMEADTQFAEADKTGARTTVGVELAVPGDSPLLEKPEPQPSLAPQNGSRVPRRLRRQRGSSRA